MIQINDLGKYFGATRAVGGLTLEVGKGEIFGLIGPNGAGKTTTIRMLATLLKPSTGDALICGQSITRAPAEARARLGYMPDQQGLYEGMTVADYLTFFAAAYRVPEERQGHVVGQILELVDLAGLRDARIAELSRGTQQRISLARVLVHNPEVLFLDEPASGLDPRARIEVREILKVLKGMGKTIFISSHILPELEEVCTRVAILDRGQMVWTGNPAEGWEREGGRRRVRVRPVTGRHADAVAALVADVRVLDAVVEGEDVVVTLARAEEGAAFVPRVLLARDIDLTRLVEERPGLEEIFLEVTRKAGEEGKGEGAAGGAGSEAAPASP